jgi:hypothetical protein
LEVALQDINSNYTFAVSQHPVRPQRLLIVGRLIEDLLATMLVGCSGYDITSTKQVDGSTLYDQNVVGDFTDPESPLNTILGSDSVQAALQSFVDAADRIRTSGGSKMSTKTLQDCQSSYPVAYTALQEAVATCKNMGDYGGAGDANAGSDFQGTSKPGYVDESRSGKNKKPTAGYSGDVTGTSRGSNW